VGRIVLYVTTREKDALKTETRTAIIMAKRDGQASRNYGGELQHD